jgi:GH15 family glucan-1,4-alpha-glucosidase
MAAPCAAQNESQMRKSGAGYLPIENYGLIGNMRTCALVGMDGSVDFMCWPEFDSPSVFCRLLDKDKGGYFSIHPATHLSCTTKQQYLPSSNILQTRYIHEDGVVDLVDFFPRPKNAKVISKGPKQGAYREMTSVQEELKQWLVRRVECIRGRLQLDVEIFPAFDYAAEPHTTTVLQEEGVPHSRHSKTATFHSKGVKLQLDVSIDRGEDNDSSWPIVRFKKVSKPGMLGEGVVASIDICEGQAVSFVIRNDVEDHITENITSAVLDTQQHDTQTYWYNWISQSKYKGRWREVVARSLMILKLMTYEPTGAIIASPTFSIPEDIGGVR